MTAPRRPAPAALTVLALVTTLAFGALAGDYLNLRFDLRPDLPSIAMAADLSQVWARVGWLLAIWLGLAGALCLWVREDAAVLIFFGAAVGALVALAGLARPPGGLPEMSGLALVGGVAALAVLAWIWARALRIGGYLA